MAVLFLGLVPLHGQVAPSPLASPPSATAGRHFVWRVAKSGTTVAWLVGSIHVLARDAYPLPDVFQKAFAESGVLIEEVDLDAATDVAALAVASGALRGGDQPLRQFLDRDTYAMVESTAATAHVPMLLLDHMKPWMVAMTLSMPALRQSGFDPALGLDRHFFDRAKADKREVRGLETMAYQIERLDGLPVDVQVAMLKAALADADTQAAAVAQIVGAWRTGDVEALERVLLQEFRESPTLYQRLLVERNQAWAPQLAACTAEPRPCLVVVGGAHLVGPDSVVALLRQAGFTVEQQ